MTSIQPNDATADTAAGLDPVHPQGAPETAATDARDAREAAEATAPAAAGRAPRRTAPQPRPASDRGTPAVLDHRVVALEVGSGTRPLVLHTADGDRDLMPREAHVWARAGRITVIGEDYAELKFTVLGPEEYSGLRLGEHWPAGEPESLPRRVATAAVRDVGDVLTFPAWLARTTRLSGQRNAALHGLVNRLRAASPKTAVHYGQTFGLEHHRPEHAHPYDHRGIVGKEGYPKEL